MTHLPQGIFNVHWLFDGYKIHVLPPQLMLTDPGPALGIICCHCSHIIPGYSGWQSQDAFFRIL